jgi:hypothetical protein
VVDGVDGGKYDQTARTKTAKLTGIFFKGVALLASIMRRSR